MASWETWNRGEMRARLTRTPIAVLMGGESNEREVSLASGQAVLGALRDLTGPAYDVTPPIFGVEIDASGRWILDGASLELHQAVRSLPDDTVFLLALHGGAARTGPCSGCWSALGDASQALARSALHCAWTSTEAARPPRPPASLWRPGPSSPGPAGARIARGPWPTPSPFPGLSAS